MGEAGEADTSVVITSGATLARRHNNPVNRVLNCIRFSRTRYGPIRPHGQSKCAAQSGSIMRWYTLREQIGESRSIWPADTGPRVVIDLERRLGRAVRLGHVAQ